MALKISLRPHERIIIGDAVIMNGDVRAHFVIENNVPVLREKDIMSEKDAHSPCRRIYFVVQLMYVDGRNLADHHRTYWDLVGEILKAAPSMLPYIDQINRHILGQRYYQALKVARKLIEYEQEVINRVYSTTRSI